MHHIAQAKGLIDCEPQIRDCFNDTVVEAMMDQTVVCAGTVLGGRTALIAYMQLMSYVAHFVARDSCTMEWGIDQVHTQGLGCTRKPSSLQDAIRMECN